MDTFEKVLLFGLGLPTLLAILALLALAGYLIGVDITDSHVVRKEVRETVDDGVIVHQERADPWFDFFVDMDHTHLEEK